MLAMAAGTQLPLGVAKKAGLCRAWHLWCPASWPLPVLPDTGPKSSVKMWLRSVHPGEGSEPWPTVCQTRLEAWQRPSYLLQQKIQPSHNGSFNVKQNHFEKIIHFESFCHLYIKKKTKFQNSFKNAVSVTLLVTNIKQFKTLGDFRRSWVSGWIRSDVLFLKVLFGKNSRKSSVNNNNNNNKTVLERRVTIFPKCQKE